MPSAKVFTKRSGGQNRRRFMTKFAQGNEDIQKMGFLVDRQTGTVAPIIRRFQL